MEAPSLNKQEFTVASVTDLTSPSSSLSSSPVVATFSSANELTQLRFHDSESTDGFCFDLTSVQVRGSRFAFKIAFNILSKSLVFETFSVL